MARISTRFSRFFKPSRRWHSKTTSPSLKSRISRPIVCGEDDTNTLLTSAHMHTHSHSSSVYTISNSELHSLEQSKLGRKIEDDIDDIIASYAHMPPTTTLDPCADVQWNRSSTSVANTAGACNSDSQPCHSAPTPSSVYTESLRSSEPSPSTTYSKSPSMSMKATLERFRDTPPPAPGWDKVSFGRETGLFGPDALSDSSHLDVKRYHDYERVGYEADEGRAGRRKDWRREFARRGQGRGYAVL